MQKLCKNLCKIISEIVQKNMQKLWKNYKEIVQNTWNFEKNAINFSSNRNLTVNFKKNTL